MHMLLEGAFAGLIVKLEPSLYQKYTWVTQKEQTNVEIKFTVLYRQHYYFGGYYPARYMSSVQIKANINYYSEYVAN